MHYNLKIRTRNCNLFDMIVIFLKMCKRRSCEGMIYWRLQVNNQKPIRLHVAINSLLRTYVNARMFKCSNVA